MKTQTSRLFRSLRAGAATAIVLAALAGLAWIGHRWDWKVPGISAFLGGTSGAAADDWCTEHNVPESKCLACNPARLESLTQGGVPAPRSDPEVLPGNSGGIAGGAADCKAHTYRVQFATAASIERAGIRLEEVRRRPFAASIRAPGRTGYDPSRTARVGSRAAGTLARMEKGIGDAVRKGEVLALVDAPEASRAKADLLLGLAQAAAREAALRRIEASADVGLRTKAELEEARAALREARFRLLGAREILSGLGIPVSLEALRDLPEEQAIGLLRRAGLPEDLAKSLDQGPAAPGLIPITAPIDGTVVEREAAVGESIEAARPFFTVADTGRLWITADVRAEDAREVRPGLALRFLPEGSLEEEIPARIIRVDPAADAITRAVRVIAEVEDSRGTLRARIHGTARIILRQESAAVTVPAAAVQWEGCSYVVFRRTGPEIFEPLRVRPGARASGLVEILEGLSGGEVVATQGSHILKSELLKGTLGAGCAGE